MWIEPKTDWAITDSFNFEDYNRIKNNIAYLRERALSFYSTVPFEDMGSDKIGYNEFPYAEEFNRLAFFLIGCINEKYRKMPLVKQMAIGATVITILEFVCGCIVNIWLGWNVWDYSNMPLNLFGQICLPFTALWFFLSAVAVILDDWIRHILWKEKIPHYKLF